MNPHIYAVICPHLLPCIMPLYMTFTFRYLRWPTTTLLLPPSSRFISLLFFSSVLYLHMGLSLVVYHSRYR
ncbi:hypothetical protein BDQ12DRAFT_691991 [Crucibulum laeve]|uniref:Uncharacterized protein n=1 Tax=Crucibulum laeve TaxID=68775 RepID=A0A5C3LKJ2_9AGAR|nr:hypothetical protein BDQ12DRAFT_691991 [Crucibulum laeve]